MADSEAWKEFQVLLSQLEQSASDDNLPVAIRSFVLRQIRSLKDALIRSSVSGSAPIREAVEKGLGEMITRQDELVEAAGSDPKKSGQIVSKLQMVWAKAAAAAKQATDINRGVALANKLWERAQVVIEKIDLDKLIQ